MDRIDRALRSREVATPDAAVVAARIEDRLATLPAGTGARRGAKIVVAGVVTSTLAVVGAGAAAAADPYSNVARAVENAAQAVGVNWSPMPEGYTRAQYDAFWGAGYSPADVEAFSELWNTEELETKALAGQKILDGETLPAPAPISDPALLQPSDPQEVAARAFWDAGYSAEDIDLLVSLWGNEDTWEVKVAAGEKLLAGEALPITPSGTPARVSPTP
ncbi:hypothetical protein QUV83_10610 [Cellulomonas cellasea]|uniref:hypothetical protein n=1 Tax=Cellulomonas cellasea TaxID=43670 RepID=UPI0025A44CE3|nr:hypothetical protein [Cellulomonas cellasea]MDM8085215.1 hypothetical protein [Cellulomonas cellasea]